MEVFLNIFLFFLMEKKSILFLHICSIKFIEPYYPLLFFASNDNAGSTKNYDLWFDSYWEKSGNIFAIILLFLVLCCVFWTVLHIFEPCHIFNCKIEPLPWTVRHGSRAFKHCHIFNCMVEPLPWTAQHGSRAFEPCHIFHCKVEPRHVFLNHAQASQIIILNFSTDFWSWKNQTCFFSRIFHKHWKVQVPKWYKLNWPCTTIGAQIFPETIIHSYY